MTDGQFTVTLGGVTYNGVLTPQPAAAPPPQAASNFQVSKAQLLDTNGKAFRIRGVNECHYDSPGSVAGIALAKANTVRVFTSDTAPTATVLQRLHDHQANGALVIPACAGAGGSGTSGNTSATILEAATAYWVNNASAFLPIQNALIINIANEWGPANSTAWRDANITAIASLRAAKYTCPLLIDAGGYGQDELNIEQYAAAVLASDPLGNTLFGVHIYGTANNYQDSVRSIAGAVITLNSNGLTHPFAPGFNGTNNSYCPTTEWAINGVGYPAKQTNVGGVPGAWTITLAAAPPAGAIQAGAQVLDYWGNYQLRIARLASLSSQGICVVISEFGPGQNVGPSPTLVTPQSIIAACETAGLGWMPWAWDDNNEAGGLTTPTGWFGMTLTGPGNYSQESDLTAFGQLIVPYWQSLAVYHT